ncbi:MULTISPECIES: DNA-directed RNA polymerase subunit omega [unclassified Sedimentibacter]|uniref:DNA-directed RNA polymerase subunit omega n=1 Tax=unclassified Sedimentibacter TaxID=2649220 RepID=UPI0035A6F07D
MRKISIDELIDMVDSRYSLVTIVSKRARQIIDGSEALVETNSIKPLAVAIEEFYEHKYDPIYNYDQYMKNLQESKANEESSEESEGQSGEDDGEQEAEDVQETEENREEQ